MADPETLTFKPDTDMPNSRLPVLIYRRALSRDTGGMARGFEDLFHGNDWHGVWRNGIYDYDHFHSTSHEVLGIEAGRARLQLGGASGVEVDVEAGDVLVLPAGTGHRRISGSLNLSVIGGYPRGQERPDLLRAVNAKSQDRIDHLSLPTTDPVQGPKGALLRLWR